jgi:hypothetical protein
MPSRPVAGFAFQMRTEVGLAVGVVSHDRPKIGSLVWIAKPLFVTAPSPHDVQEIREWRWPVFFPLAAALRRRLVEGVGLVESGVRIDFPPRSIVNCPASATARDSHFGKTCSRDILTSELPQNAHATAITTYLGKHNDRDVEPTQDTPREAKGLSSSPCCWCAESSCRCRYTTLTAAAASYWRFRPLVAELAPELRRWSQPTGCPGC